jgi:prevent-host-death family protein
MSTMRINIREARQRFSEIINNVAVKRERVIITSRNKPKAVLVSLQDAERLEEGSARRKRRRFQLESILKLREGLAQKGVRGDSMATLEKLREDRLGRVSNGR